MKALTIKHSEVTRKALLETAERIKGAWIGIRIAAYLLVLSGWKSTQVAELFGLTRCVVVRWIQKANERGINAIEDIPRIGRHSQFDERVMRELEDVLSKSPKEFEIQRVRWDGVMLVEYLKRTHHIKIHVRHAQRLIRKAGYSLRQPIYRFVQASRKGVRKFRNQLKKTPDGYRK